MKRIHALWRGVIVALALTFGIQAAQATAVTLPYVFSPSGQQVTSTAAVLTDSAGAEKGTAGNPVITSGASSTTACGGVTCAKDASVTAVAAQLPSTLGAKTSANSLSIAPASDATFPAATTGANVSVTPTIQNAAYATTNCMGGFQTVALGTSVSVLSQIGILSKGGLATAKLLYVFSANPTGSTCTDKSTFTLAAADVSKVMLIVSLTPAATTGTSVSSAFASNLGLGVPSGGTVYLAIVDTATETPATTGDLVANFSAF